MARYDKPYLRNTMRLRYLALAFLSTLSVGCTAVTDLFWSSSYDGPIPTLPGPVDDSGVLLPTEPEPTSPKSDPIAERRQFKLDRILSLGIDCGNFYSDHNVLILEPGTDLANPSTTDPALDGYLSHAQEVEYCRLPQIK